MNPRLSIGIVAVALVLSGACGQKRSDPGSKSTSHAATDSIVRLGPWAGTLLCADCAGIRTELTLFAAPSGEPAVYHLRQTYLGTRDGDRTFTSTGRWRTARGTPTDPNAEIYQLAFDKPDEQRSFRLIGADSLRLLDRSGAEIESTAPYTLVRGAPSGGPPPPVLVAVERAATVALRPEQEFFVRLAANHTTGFQWALTDTARGTVAPQSTLYVQDQASGLALGVGGNEYWRLRALAPGEQTLRFVYQRPWEKQATPARTAELHVRVR